MSVETVEPLVASLVPANRGTHFRAYSLRDNQMDIAPFLGVDHVWMSAPTFPPHTHSQLAVLSYVFLDSETAMSNRDSLGNRNMILPGGLHWTMAGSGIVHEEIPAEAGKTVHSLQIFIAASREMKNLPPESAGLAPHEIPSVHKEGAKIRVVLGSFANVHSPLKVGTHVDVLDISLDDGAELFLPIVSDNNVFIMPICGEISVNGHHFDRSDFRIPVFPQQKEDFRVRLQAIGGKVKVVLFAGVPMLSE